MQRLSDPVPNYPHRSPPAQCWPVISKKDLPRDFFIPVVDFVELLEKRRSRRKFEPVQLQTLATLLWISARHVRCAGDKFGGRHCPYPSAGGMAAVRLIVVSREFGCWLYDAANHSSEIMAASHRTISDVYAEVSEFYDPTGATLLIFAADLRFAEHFYENPESLLLRESGVMTATLAYVAELLGLGFCPLGTQAGRWLQNLLRMEHDNQVAAVGAALVGSLRS